MSDESRDVWAIGGAPHRLRAAEGGRITPPDGWALLPPGDATWTRRVKAEGPSWTVKVQKGRRIQSLGVWAPEARIAEVRAALDAERATPEYEKARVSQARRRDRVQAAYVEDFHGAILDFLDFDEGHLELAGRLADAVCAHATPIGSGTVARTKRIPVEQRAEAAVIAWMRHHTTAYDQMSVARIKGERREVRRMLAQRSRRLLHAYRRGEPAPAGCPLRSALEA